MSLLPAIELLSSPEKDVDASVIWLHGLGADGNDFAAIVPELNLPKDLSVRFIFPHAPSIPVTINGGFVMPAWYDIKELSIDRKVDEVQLLQSAAAVHAFVDREIERGVDSRRIILAGFSQGGAVILQAALTCVHPLAAALSLSSYFPTADIIEPREQNAKLPVLVCHGTHDNVVGESLGLAAVDSLKEMGHPVEYKSYPMEHSVCPAQIADLSKWFQGVLA
ncbi:MAG: dienelactone hydrolase family protein [Pseudohongiellaceae bacterium]|nr:dienelactone hydrolase family protein [Pseudohongiellaceae bacterium]